MTAPIHVAANITLEAWEPFQPALFGRLAGAIAEGRSSLPFYGHFFCAFKAQRAEALERIASCLKTHFPGVSLNCVDADTLCIAGEPFFAPVDIYQKPRHGTLRFRVWAASPEVFRDFEAKIRESFASLALEGKLFSARWVFSSKDGLSDAYAEEIFSEKLLASCYPALALYGGPEAFIEKYLEADESVLILQGNPGVGKTRLIRGLLASMAEKNRKKSEKDHSVTALYSGDAKALENDELFARFITGDEEALVIEDVDLYLKPRTGGNDVMHHFLAASDGVIQSDGRKIIFSSNLPNVKDIDEALTRKGRCFAHIHLGALTREQTQRALEEINNGDVSLAAKALSLLSSQPDSAHSLAEIYDAVKRAKNAP